MAFKIKNSANFKPRVTSNFRQQIKSGLTWYCDKTSLHGFHYISDKESSVFTRLFFAAVSCCSFVLCIYLIILQFNEYKDRSIMTTITSTAYPVWKVRFPSVTICNFNVVYKDNIKHVLSALQSRGVNETAFIDLVYNLSSLIIYDDLEDMSSYKEVYNILQDSGYNTDRLMAELAQPCRNMVRQCFWQTEEIPCSYIFRSVKTTQGYCCAFNYNGTHKPSEETEVNSHSQNYQYVGGAGPSLGLRVVLDAEETQYASPIRPSYGLNILVQDGIDYPDMDLIANTIRTADELTISVTPRIYVSTRSIRNMDPEQRHCLFDKEGDLEWTSIYSYKTCISECIAKTMFAYCKCIPFYYPFQNRKRYCTLLDVPCLQANRHKYTALDLTDGFVTEDELQNNEQNISEFSCNCYPQCNERMFDLHTDRAKATRMVGYDFTNMSILTVYYNTVGCIRTERDVYYTWDRVLASIGGIFGLCLGGSVISILECLYFFCKCLFNFNTIKPNREQSTMEGDKLPGIYITDFKYHHRQLENSLGKKLYVRSKTNDGK